MKGRNQISEASVARLIARCEKLHTVGGWISWSEEDEQLKGGPMLTDSVLSLYTKTLHRRGVTAPKSVDLQGCRNITDAGVAELAKLAQLTSVNLYGCSRITDAAKQTLRRRGVKMYT